MIITAPAKARTADGAQALARGAGLTVPQGFLQVRGAVLTAEHTDQRFHVWHDSATTVDEPEDEAGDDGWVSDGDGGNMNEDSLGSYKARLEP